MTARDLLYIAAQEVGYIGKKSAADLDVPTANITGKYTKYARDLYEAGYYNGNKQGYSWCAVFVDWCFWKAADCDKAEAAKVKPNGTLGASVKYTYNYYNKVGRISDVPKVGAQIFYKNDSGEFVHTGIVEQVYESYYTKSSGEVVTDNYIITIEGNWSNSVTRRSLKVNDPSIVGYGLPFYEEEVIPEPEPEPVPAVDAARLRRISDLFESLRDEFAEWADEADGVE